MAQETDPTRYSVQEYFDLVTRGVLQPDDRVELLEGVIVAEPPMDPPHASGITRVDRALRRALGERVIIRVQQPFIVGGYSVPEPDVAVVPGTEADYDTQHPTQALLIVEVAASSLPQDRLTKSRIYAAAHVPEYWVVNLRDRCVEVFRDPDAVNRMYRAAGWRSPATASVWRRCRVCRSALTSCFQGWGEVRLAPPRRSRRAEPRGLSGGPAARRWGDRRTVGDRISRWVFGRPTVENPCEAARKGLSQRRWRCQ